MALFASSSVPIVALIELAAIAVNDVEVDRHRAFVAKTQRRTNPSHQSPNGTLTLLF